jgi:hypothetical protein
MTAKGTPEVASDGDFLSHLVAVLSIYELGPFPAPLPQYKDKTDWQAESIMRSLTVMAHRMYNAEEQLAAMKASHSGRHFENGSDPQHRHFFHYETPHPPCSDHPSAAHH